MKLDHFVVNVDEKYQKEKAVIDDIRSAGFPYEPKWGKGTKGFKVSNLWTGNEYLEMVNVLRADGGSWVPEWTEQYNKGHRGLICLILDIENMDELYRTLSHKKIPVTTPQWLEFKWFFKLFTRRMPWRNFYVPFFEQVPLQIGFQEMKDEKSREFMNQYMVPNAREKGIEEITKVTVRGGFTNNDFVLLKAVFGDFLKSENGEMATIELPSTQLIEFKFGNNYQVELFTNSSTGNCVEIENVKIHC